MVWPLETMKRLNDEAAEKQRLVTENEVKFSIDDLNEGDAILVVKKNGYLVMKRIDKSDGIRPDALQQTATSIAT